MPTHLVEQGECLSSLAARVGLQAKDLHDLSANADLKKNRPYPNILAPGDVVEIPEPNQKWESASTDKVNRFVVSSPKVKLRIVLLDVRGNPYQGKRFAITIGAKESKGTTTSAGLIECDVPADAQNGHLRVWLNDGDPDPHIDRDLAIGHLDPIDTVTGVQARLDNLGYSCNVTGEMDDATLMAARRFRADNGLDDGTEPHQQGAAEDGGSSNSDDATNGDPGRSNEDTQNDEPAPEFSAEKLIDARLRVKLQGLYEAR